MKKREFVLSRGLSSIILYLVFLFMYDPLFDQNNLNYKEMSQLGYITLNNSVCYLRD